MEWSKILTASAGRQGGWRDDFPLDQTLPHELRVSLENLREPVHPMLLVRLQLFVDWHRSRGHDVMIEPPRDPATRSFVSAMGLTAESADHADVVLPVTKLREYLDVEDVSGRALDRLEYELHDVARTGQPAYMALSELCNNAVEHGANDLGVYVAVRRMAEPQPQWRPSRLRSTAGAPGSRAGSYPSDQRRKLP